MPETVKQWLRRMRRDVVAVFYAARDPRTPLLPRTLALMLVVYTFSPIDLIPTFLPMLGEFADLLVFPVLFVAVIRLLPGPVLEESRARADAGLVNPRTRMAGHIVNALSAACAVGVAVWVVWR